MQIFHKIKLVKKEYPFEPSRTVTTELVTYGVLIVAIVFGTARFCQEAGLSNMLATAIITVASMILVSIYLYPHLKSENPPAVIADAAEGVLSKGRAAITRNDAKKIFVLSYSLGRDRWLVTRIVGARSIGVDTRNYPEADRLDNFLAKVFPKIRVVRISAKSPFYTIVYSCLGYLLILFVIGMVI
jgi:hypothetical protein